MIIKKAELCLVSGNLPGLAFVSRGFVLTMGALSFFSERQREEFTKETNYYLYQSRAKSGTVETEGLLRRCGPPNGAEGQRNGAFDQPTLSGFSSLLCELLGKPL